MLTRRNYCHHCGRKIEHRLVGGLVREYCLNCKITFYNNPVPVVSSVMVNPNKELLLVLRDQNPKAGMWCLPSGFVEKNETIENGALRELFEETHIEGEVIQLLDTVSYDDEFYGNLIWVSFEVKYINGDVIAGDDARAARFFPIDEIPELAFPPNTRVIKKYLDYYNRV